LYATSFQEYCFPKLPAPIGTANAGIVSPVVIFAYKRLPHLTVLRVTRSGPVRYLVYQRVVPSLRAIHEESHMKTAKLLPAVAAVVVAFVSPSAFADNADFRFRIDIGAPPARVIAYVPVAMPGHVWVPGHLAWNGHRQVWNSGVWERPRPHYRQAAGHWEQRNEPRRFEPPRWQAHQIAERRGQTHDYGRQVRYEDRRDQAFRDRDARRGYSR
jgi:hypothetical protein